MGISKFSEGDELVSESAKCRVKADLLLSAKGLPRSGSKEKVVLFFDC